MNLEEKDTGQLQIDFPELFSIILERKRYILGLTFLIGALTLIFSFLQPKIYKAHTLLVPASENSIASSMLNQYSGLAGLAGINLPNESPNKTLEAIERIKSLDFFSEFILPNINLEDLMAVQEWNSVNNTITYDDDLFDKTNNTWVREVDFPFVSKPSKQESHEKYLEKLSVTQDQNSSFVTISIEHQSPYLARDWIKIIIHAVNTSFREQEKSLTTKSISFLNKQLEEAKYENVRKALSSIIQEQTKSLMVIDANDDFIFKHIEPPFAPELESKPRKFIYLLFGLIVGFLIAILSILISRFNTGSLFKAV